MERSITVWEDDGGSQPGIAENEMTGTLNQIDWAVRIRRQVNAEFDRVRWALESVARNRRFQPVQSRFQIDGLIAILEDRRAEVMRRTDAGYFIHDWQELRDHVRRLILDDPRYKGGKSS